MQRHARLLFFERVPFMGVELLDLIDDYRIACYGRSPEFDLLRRAWPVLANVPDLSDRPANDEAVRQLLSDRAFVENLTADTSDAVGICFYMDQTIADAFRHIRLKTALADYRIQHDLGSKANLGRICAAARVPINESIVIQSAGDPIQQFARCSKNLGLPFIAQGAFGVSGEDTGLIDEPEQLRRFCGGVAGEIRASRFIPNMIPLSLQVCVSGSNGLIRGPYLQLVGLPQLSSNPFQFCGNDTGQSLLEPSARAGAVDIARRLVRYSAEAGYAGILGIDLLWDLSRNAFYVQELNTRLVGLTRLLTGAQKDLGFRPDLLEHLSLFGHLQFSAKAQALDSSDEHLLNGDYSQLLVFSEGPTRVVNSDVAPGIYKFEGGELQFRRPELFLERLAGDEVMFAYTLPKGQYAGPGSLLARILLKRSVVRSDVFALDSLAVSLVCATRSVFLDPGCRRGPH